jgi:hypothetical protein
MSEKLEWGLREWQSLSLMMVACNCGVKSQMLHGFDGWRFVTVCFTYIRSIWACEGGFMGSVSDWSCCYLAKVCAWQIIGCMKTNDHDLIPIQSKVQNPKSHLSK